MNQPEPPVAPWRTPMHRRDAGRLLGGVCAGLADQYGLNVVLLRMLFAVVAPGGLGLLAYVALWLFMPAAADSPPPPAGVVLRSLLPRSHGADRNRRRHLLGYVALGVILGSILSATGIGLGRGSTLPLTLAGIGALLIWWRAPQSKRLRWSHDARHLGSRLARRGSALVVLGGVGLVVAGVTAFLATNNALAQAKAGALAIGATLVGSLLVTGPWLFRLLRELTEERRQRIREHERAELAAHVHDSVLQTLALIQADASDPDAVRRLARSQERELRAWLYQTDATAPAGLAALLREAAAEVEDAYGVTVDVIVVGDAPLDEGLRALGAAAREAMVNAAKSSGAPLVSVFAEVAGDATEVFVRDRGHGFDLQQIPADRHGIRDSIVGRMHRHGGEATIRSSADGTEVMLSLTRRVRT